MNGIQPISRTMENFPFLKKVIVVLWFGHAMLFGQQNLVNVPATEATEKRKIFFQQQVNFNELLQSNTTFDYGLGRGYEIGVNILGLNFSEKRESFLNNDSNDVDPYNPLLLLNGFKQFVLGKNVCFGTGGQLGLNFNADKKSSNAGLLYANLLFKDIIIKKSRYIVGAYYNSDHYGGEGNRIGCWLGSEIPLYHKLHFLAESILGSNALCYTSLGLIYSPKSWLPLTLGIQIPNNSRNSYSIVFELTYQPSAKQNRMSLNQ